MSDIPNLTTAARAVAAHLDQHFDPATAAVRQVLAVAEEAGEFVGAYRRAAGLARRPGPWTDVRAELADVVITAYVAATVLGIDLDTAISHKLAVIHTRGWRTSEGRPA
jgi:NTP pyrophosphatase (non-canonical NTP hydrolase)